VNLRRHLTGDEIAAAADGERAPRTAVESHLEQCGVCRAAVSESIAIRTFVTRSAQREVSPEHDIVRRTLAAIRAREEAVASVNEAVGTFGSIVRSIVGFAIGRQR